MIISKIRIYSNIVEVECYQQIKIDLPWQNRYGRLICKYAYSTMSLYMYILPDPTSIAKVDSRPIASDCLLLSYPTLRILF